MRITKQRRKRWQLHLDSTESLRYTDLGCTDTTMIQRTLFIFGMAERYHIKEKIMYLDLSQTYFFFECVLEPDFNYFNLEDYQTYSKEERQSLINSNTYETKKFIPIPQIGRNEIVEKYLIKNNNKNLLRKFKSRDFYRIFHRYIEENHLVDDWNDFEKSELIEFASMWCEENQIKFTSK